MHANGSSNDFHHHETYIKDNVLRYPPTGIDVIVVGAGIGGLLTALECWRKGHNIFILEKSTALSHLGDIVSINPSAMTTFRHYPSMLKEYTTTVIDAEVKPHRLDGQLGGPTMEFEFNRDDVAEHAAFPIRVGAIIGRADLVSLFHRQCQRLDIPIQWGTSVVDYEEDEERGLGITVSADGTRYSADIVISSDGLGSKSHRLILGEAVRAVTTGYTVYRAAMSPSALRDAPRLQNILANLKRPEARLYTGRNQHLVFIVSSKLICFNMTLPDEGRGHALESWSSTITAEDMLSRIPNSKELDPCVVEAIRNFQDGGIVAWRLCMRDPQRLWTSKAGHVAQVGDSAHSFIPTSANGATMAMEDAISIAECLHKGGKSGCGTSTKVHQVLRQERTTLVQRMGLRNRVAFHQDSIDKIDVTKVAHMGKWVWTHNPEKYSADNFAQARAHLEGAADFQNTNLPPGYQPQSWTLDGEIEREKTGKVFDLTTNGDWSLV